MQGHLKKQGTALTLIDVQYIWTKGSGLHSVINMIVDGMKNIVITTLKEVCKKS